MRTFKKAFAARNHFQPEDLKEECLRTSLVVQWLRLCTSTAGGTGSIPGLGTKIPHAFFFFFFFFFNFGSTTLHVGS